MEIFSVGKKKGQATTANPSATQCGSKEKPALFFHIAHQLVQLAARFPYRLLDYVRFLQ
jgi:hypothetical protein